MSVVLIDLMNKCSAVFVSFRSVGRLARVVDIDVPDKNGPLEKFCIFYTCNIMLDNDVMPEAVIRQTQGFVGVNIVVLRVGGKILSY